MEEVKSDAYVHVKKGWKAIGVVRILNEQVGSNNVKLDFDE